MIKRTSTLKSSGYLILEALISVVILGMIIVSVFPTVNFMIKRSKRSVYDSQASLLLQEGLEVAYNVFFTTSDWNDFNTGVPYKRVTEDLDGDGDVVWKLIEGTDEDLETRFDRTIVINEVCRKADTGSSDDGTEVVCPSGTVDPHSKKVITTVTWEENGQPKSITASLLLLKTTE